MNCVILPTLDFSLVTDNDEMIQIDIRRQSDCSFASVESAKWELFAPGTRDVVLTKEGADIYIIPTGIKFMIDHTDTADLDAGVYTHEATVVTSDGRIHTVTDGDFALTPGKLTLRTIYTLPPS